MRNLTFLTGSAVLISLVGCGGDAGTAQSMGAAESDFVAADGVASSSGSSAEVGVADAIATSPTLDEAPTDAVEPDSTAPGDAPQAAPETLDPAAQAAPSEEPGVAEPVVESASASDDGAAEAIVSVPSPLVVGQPRVINFRPAAAPMTEGSLSETGQVFGVREAGWTYGFSADHTQRGTYYAPVESLGALYPFWSRVQMQPGAVWEVAVVNGVYRVAVTAGGWTANTLHQQLLAEGVTVVDDVPGDYHIFVSGTATVEVSDGRLTLESGPLAEGNEIGMLGLTLLEELP